MNRLNNKVMLGVLTLPLISLGLVLWYSGRLLTAVHARKAVERARALPVFCEEIRTFIGGYHGRGMFRLPELMAAVEATPAGRGNCRDTRLYPTMAVDAFQAADEEGRGGENAAADSAFGESSSGSGESGETGADERLEGKDQ